MAPDQAALIAEILNSCYLVRHYERGGRSSIHRLERDQAIQRLGLACRYALNASDDFEPILSAIVDGLRPREGKAF